MRMSTRDERRRDHEHALQGDKALQEQAMPAKHDELVRLPDTGNRNIPRKTWGPHLSERRRGTGISVQCNMNTDEEGVQS